jgi:hypothetical protein
MIKRVFIVFRKVVCYSENRLLGQVKYVVTNTIIIGI